MVVINNDWDVIAIGPSLGVQESRLTLKGSMQLVGRCVKFCRKFQGPLEHVLGIGVS